MYPWFTSFFSLGSELAYYTFLQVRTVGQFKFIKINIQISKKNIHFNKQDCVKYQTKEKTFVPRLSPNIACLYDITATSSTSLRLQKEWYHINKQYKSSELSKQNYFRNRANYMCWRMHRGLQKTIHHPRPPLPPSLNWTGCVGWWFGALLCLLIPVPFILSLPDT